MIATFWFLFVLARTYGAFPPWTDAAIPDQVFDTQAACLDQARKMTTPSACLPHYKKHVPYLDCGRACWEELSAPDNLGPADNLSSLVENETTDDLIDDRVRLSQFGQSPQLATVRAELTKRPGLTEAYTRACQSGRWGGPVPLERCDLLIDP
jgi:hypothetical protein